MKNKEQITTLLSNIETRQDSKEMQLLLAGRSQEWREGDRNVHFFQYNFCNKY